MNIKNEATMGRAINNTVIMTEITGFLNTYMQDNNNGRTNMNKIIIRVFAIVINWRVSILLIAFKITTAPGKGERAGVRTKSSVRLKTPPTRTDFPFSPSDISWGNCSVASS